MSEKKKGEWTKSSLKGKSPGTITYRSAGYIKEKKKDEKPYVPSVDKKKKNTGQ